MARRRLDCKAHGLEATDELADVLPHLRTVHGGMTLLRGTPHLVSRTGASRLRPLLQVMLERAVASSPFARELAPPAKARRSKEVLSGRRKPMTVAEIADAVVPMTNLKGAAHSRPHRSAAFTTSVRRASSRS
jgi:hypothetical protein